MSEDGDKKYDPTPRRREKFREEGRLARARDAGPLVAAFAAIGAVVGTFEDSKGAVERLFRASLGDVAALHRGEGAGVWHATLEALAVLLVPPIVAAALGAIVIGFVQSGIGLNLGLVGFKFERLNPIGKIKEMFSPKHGSFELGLALAKVAIVGTVTVLAAREEAKRLLSLSGADFVTGSGMLLAAIVHVVLHALVATAIIAAADYAHSWFKLEQEMKMTLQELKDDMRSDDGDPHVKAKMRARARQNAKKRMMADVKHAAVIVTNPTHVSVALRYAGNDPAPIVVAKGHDEVALAIRREARAHGVPIMENRRLARALDAQIPIGKPVKVEHFAAVAKLLSLVYALKRRPRGAAQPGMTRA